jgi:hypothetical protein
LIAGTVFIKYFLLIDPIFDDYFLWAKSQIHVMSYLFLLLSQVRFTYPDCFFLLLQHKRLFVAFGITVIYVGTSFFCARGFQLTLLRMQGALLIIIVVIPARHTKNRQQHPPS